MGTIAASGLPKHGKETKMKNNYSIAERNRIVEEHLPQIDRTIRQNRAQIRTAHLDKDDVYQELAIRLIRCVENFDPEKGTLEAHIDAQLQYELLSCKDSRRRYGFTHVPYDLRGAVVSLSDCGGMPDTLALAA